MVFAEDKCQTLKNEENCTYRVCEERGSCNDNLTSKVNVKDLLKNVSFKLYKQDCNNESKYNVIKNNFNEICNCTANSTKPFFRTVPVKKNMEKIIQSIWPLILVMGIICLLANILVVTKKIKPIWKKIQQPKELKIYSILILNLSIADLLMGIYLVGISVKMKKNNDQSNYVVESWFCNSLGITNLVSSQVSLTTLVGISYFRLYSLIRPYKQVSVKPAVALVVATWAFWIPFAILPIKFYPVGAKSSINNTNYYLDNFFDVEKFIDGFVGKGEIGSSFDCVIKATANKADPKILLLTLESFGIINSSDWTFMGYYTKQHICALNFFIKKIDSPKDTVTLILVITNLLFCVSIIIAYIILLYKVSGLKQIRKVLLNLGKKRTFDNTQHHFNKRRNKENKTMFIRITVIIITDLLTWMLICLFSLCFHLFCLRKESMKMWHQIFQIIVLFLVPINSIINPCIYSNRVFKHMFLKLIRK